MTDEFKQAIHAELLNMQHERCKAWSFGDRIYWVNARGDERVAYFWHYWPRKKVVALYMKRKPTVTGWHRVSQRTANRWFNRKRYYVRNFVLKDVLRVEMSRVSHAQRKRMKMRPHHDHPVHTWKTRGYCNTGENS